MKKLAVKITIIIILFTAVLLVGIVIGGFFHKEDEKKTAIAGNVEKYAEDQNYEDLEESPSIAVPGYDTFEFKANEVTQDITLFNPEENTCYFKISLILEDGTIIWTSDLLEPGMSFTSINLEKPLKAGTYENVQVKYDCYSLKSLAQLNGADIKVTLIVK